MIATTVSFFRENTTKTQFQNEDSDEKYSANRIDRKNPQWITILFNTVEASNRYIEECKKNSTFSAIIAVRNLYEL
jgi:CRISPR/Cas system CSM-associated protein Csm3 (group 7 of RAMP superfamily)